MKQQGRLVVIGGGISGVSAAQAARQEHPSADITLLSAEPYPFYNKIALNTFVTGKRRQRHLHFYELDWLHSQRIEALWGEVVEAIDPDQRSLTLTEGRELAYDRLILATGARPLLPPIKGVESERVMPLWSLDDAVKIRESLESAGDVFVLGAGVLGVETAIDLANAGQHVTLADVQDAVMPLHLDSEASTRYQRFLSEKGVDLRLGSKVVGFEERENGVELSMSDGSRLFKDVVLLLTGVTPNIELARAAGIECDRGIVVDEHLQTSVPGILACGNCVELDGELRLLWNAAKSQAEVAGLNAFEQKATFTATPPVIHVKSPQLPLFVCGYGQDPEAGDFVFIDGSDDSYRKIVLGRDRAIKTIICLGDTSGSWELEKATTRKQIIPDTVDDVDGVIDACGDRADDQNRGWVCQMCGYTHESADPPEVCPVCAVGKDQFIAA